MFSSIRARLTLSHLAVIVLAMGLSGFLFLLGFGLGNNLLHDITGYRFVVTQFH